MLDFIEAGGADGIIAWHPDRLARNAFDGGRIIDLIDQNTRRSSSRNSSKKFRR